MTNLSKSVEGKEISLNHSRNEKYLHLDQDEEKEQEDRIRTLQIRSLELNMFPKNSTSDS